MCCLLLRIDLWSWSNAERWPWEASSVNTSSAHCCDIAGLWIYPASEKMKKGEVAKNGALKNTKAATLQVTLVLKKCSVYTEIVGKVVTPCSVQIVLQSHLLCHNFNLLWGYHKNQVFTGITEQLSSEACPSSALIDIQRCLTLSIRVPYTSLLPSKPLVLLSRSTFTSWLTCWWVRGWKRCAIFKNELCSTFKSEKKNPLLSIVQNPVLQ